MDKNIDNSMLAQTVPAKTEPETTSSSNSISPQPTKVPVEENLIPPAVQPTSALISEPPTTVIEHLATPPSTTNAVPASNSGSPPTTSEQQPAQVLPAQVPAPANLESKQDAQSQQITPQKAVVTKVKLSDELNIFDWFRSTDIINQIAEKAKNSVDSVITVLDPGMKEYLYSGGNINIIVISDSERLVSPIRDAFQTVFGRATVVAARYNPPETASDYPVKLACGFEGAITVAQERIKRLRNDTSTIPQNQVVVVIQPTIVNVVTNDSTGSRLNQGLNVDENLLPKWFLTYSMIIEDPVLGSTMNSYSQFIPIDTEIVIAAKEVKFPEGFSDSNLGFACSISDLMIPKLNAKPNNSDDPENEWIYIWSGLDEIKIVHDLSISLAHLYRRKWNSCVQ